MRPLYMRLISWTLQSGSEQQSSDTCKHGEGDGYPFFFEGLRLT
jgi:hypothetical protein